MSTTTIRTSITQFLIAAPFVVAFSTSSPTHAETAPTPGTNAGQPATTKKIGPQLAPLLGKAYKQMNDGKFDPAVKTLNKAVATDRQSITARRYLAFALVKKGDPKDAIKELNVIVKQESKKPTYFEWCTFGEAYLEAGALDQAENCYKQALKIAPTSEYAKSGVIRCNMRAGNYDEAKQIAADAMKATKDKDHYNYYKNLYIAAGEAALRGGAVNGGSIGSSDSSNSQASPAPKPTGTAKSSISKEEAKIAKSIENARHSGSKSQGAPGE